MVNCRISLFNADCGTNTPLVIPHLVRILVEQPKVDNLITFVNAEEELGLRNSSLSGTGVEHVFRILMVWLHMVGDRWEAKEEAMENDVNGTGTAEVAQGWARGVVDRFRWDGRSAPLFER